MVKFFGAIFSADRAISFMLTPIGVVSCLIYLINSLIKKVDKSKVGLKQVTISPKRATL